MSHDAGIAPDRSRLFRKSRRLIVAIAATGALALTGCSSSHSTSSSSSSAPASSASSSAAQSSSPAGATALFGSGCATLNLTDASTAQFASQPVVTAATAMPFFTSVVAAATAAGVVDTLNAAPALTVFAPDDPAFAKQPIGELQSLLTDPAQKQALIATLEYHVVPSEVAKAQLTGSHTSLQGAPLTVAGTGDSFTVNGSANILCGPIKTKNAYIYVIDSVLTPAS